MSFQDEQQLRQENKELLELVTNLRVVQASNDQRDLRKWAYTQTGDTETAEILIAWVNGLS